MGGWVAGDNFYGRAELLRLLADPAERCVYLVGTRRIAKTSLLRRVATSLAPAAVYCGLMRAAAHVAGHTVLDEVRLVAPLRRELVRLAAHSAPLAATRSVWDKPGATLCLWLEAAALAWEARGHCVTLLWDEAELLLRMPAPALMCLRALAQGSAGLRLLLCASKGLAAINDRWREEGSPFLFGFRTYALGGLDDSAANDLIT